MEWAEEYETGLPELDALHHRLVVPILDIGPTDECISRSRIRHTVVRLEQLARDHFAREEALMIATHYSSVAEHVDAHARLLQELQTYRDTNIFKGSQLGRVLFSWVMSDILMQDRGLAFHVLRTTRTPEPAPTRLSGPSRQKNDAHRVGAPPRASERSGRE
jgi:hemerythrin-like metal-binding protein